MKDIELSKLTADIESNRKELAKTKTRDHSKAVQVGIITAILLGLGLGLGLSNNASGRTGAFIMFASLVVCFCIGYLVTRREERKGLSGVLARQRLEDSIALRDKYLEERMNK